MSSVKPPIWVVLGAHFRADPRKTGVLVLLTVVMLFMYVRWMVQSGPSEANASTDLVAPAGADALHGDSAMKERSPSRRITLHTPLPAAPRRNPFALDLAEYPLASGGNQERTEAYVVETPPDGKAAWQEADWQLQGIMISRHPVACINGKVLRVGDQIRACRLVRIEPQRVFLQHGDDLFVLKLD